MQFSEIHNQEAIKQRLIRSVRDNRISHAQLFLGPEGSGSLALAVAYAQYILCREKNENDSCGKCPSCIKASKLEHPDLHFSFPIVKERSVQKSDDLIAEFRSAFIKQPYMNLRFWYAELDAEAKTGIIPTEEAGSVIHKLNYKSYEGEYKILVMWMPEMMNATASNNLLKIIEEPPDQTLFILVAENQENILPTILSRTQIIKIPRLDEEVIRGVLVTEHSLSPEDANSLAVIAEGNLWLAKNLVTEVEDSGFNMETFRQWMLLCHKKNIPGLLDWVDEIASMNREQQRNFIRYALHIFRQCIIGTYSDNELLRVREDERDFISRFSQFVHGNNIVALMNSFNKSHYYIERNANPKLVFINLSFTVTTLMFPKNK